MTNASGSVHSLRPELQGASHAGRRLRRASPRNGRCRADRATPDRATLAPCHGRARRLQPACATDRGTAGAARAPRRGLGRRRDLDQLAGDPLAAPRRPPARHVATATAAPQRRRPDPRGRPARHRAHRRRRARRAREQLRHAIAQSRVLPKVPGFPHLAHGTDAGRRARHAVRSRPRRRSSRRRRRSCSPRRPATRSAPCCAGMPYGWSSSTAGGCVAPPRPPWRSCTSPAATAPAPGRRRSPRAPWLALDLEGDARAGASPPRRRRSRRASRPGLTARAAPEATVALLDLLNRSAFTAQAYQAGDSFLRDFLGVQVFDRALHLPTTPPTRSALPFPFDLEGTGKRPLRHRSRTAFRARRRSTSSTPRCSDWRRHRTPAPATTHVSRT